VTTILCKVELLSDPSIHTQTLAMLLIITRSEVSVQSVHLG